MPSGFERMVQQIIFLGAGLISALMSYYAVLDSSGDSFLATIAFVATLSFWIGTLTVVFKWIFRQGRR